MATKQTEKLRNCFLARPKPLERINFKWHLSQFESIFIVSKLFQVLQTLVSLRKQFSQLLYEQISHVTENQKICNYSYFKETHHLKKNSR